MLIGTLLSPYIFGTIKYYGCYGLAISLNAFVTVYFLLFVKEIPRAVSNEISNVCEKIYDKTEKVSKYGTVSNTSCPNAHEKARNEILNNQTLFNNNLCTKSKYFFSQIKMIFMTGLISFTEMVSVVIRKRKGRLQFLIVLILSIYALFWFALEEMLMQYNYLIEAFPGFDGDDMAWFSATSYICSEYYKCFLNELYILFYKYERPKN